MTAQHHETRDGDENKGDDFDNADRVGDCIRNPGVEGDNCQ